MVVYTASHPFSLDHGGESMTLRVAQRELRLPESTVDELVGVRLERERPLVGALSPLVRQLTSDFSARGHSVGTRMVHAAINMLGAIVIETSRESGHPTRQAELDAVLVYVEENLPRPDLSVAEIASANFMSARKLHALFTLEETTVAA